MRGERWGERASCSD